MSIDQPIYIFYHVYLMGDYKLVIQEQIQKVFLSGLYDECTEFRIYISAPNENKDKISWVSKITKPFEKIKLCTIDIDKTNLPNDYRESKITLQKMREFVETHPGFYCFFHTKGIFNRGYNIDMWRISCDWAIFKNWRECIKMLNEGLFDAVGPNLRFNTFLGHHPHFSGGYWFATQSHLTKLNDTYLTDTQNKYLEEFWIGSNYNAKLGSIYECGHDAPYVIENEIDNFIKA